jgi:hypothetical protein
MAARRLLVHSPLVGRATWDLVAADLVGCGYQVGVPDLVGTVAAGPPYCSRQAEVIVGSVSGESAILIGHSGRDRCWPRRVPSSVRSAVTCSPTPRGVPELMRII